MELLFNPLGASKTNIATRGVPAACIVSTAAQPEETSHTVGTNSWWNDVQNHTTYTLQVAFGLLEWQIIQ
jgi:hypothetical protein